MLPVEPVELFLLARRRWPSGLAREWRQLRLARRALPALGFVRGPEELAGATLSARQRLGYLESVEVCRRVLGPRTRARWSAR